MIIIFAVNGVPKPQPRPRAFMRGNRAGVYDPGTAAEWKYRVAAAAKTIGIEKWDELLDGSGPIEISIEFRMPRPKSHFNSRGELKPNAPQYHLCKPDLDNLVKAVLDALVTERLIDDARVASLAAKKIYDAQPGCSIMIAGMAE